ncbi:MAG: hypothetical protein WAX14_08350 [Rhodococcus sp. (in: high G+C Gram-positive bacteria)]|uniref:hypothetical protein n=1 Tax=Rhodococcus sp. TaxID=1831 RepID=UPI003BB52587
MNSRYPSEWIDVDDVQVGDRLVCLLADADAYPTVTGWEDITYKTTNSVYRQFEVNGDRPWWVDDGHLAVERPGQAHIVSR